MNTNQMFLSEDYWNRAAKWTKLMTSAMKVRIRFTREGWHQLASNKSLSGSTFAKSLAIKKELALYIAAHEEQGIHFDTELEELVYQNGVTLILRKGQGIWFITDVVSGSEVAYEPVFVWKQLKRGCDIILGRVLACWRNVQLSDSSTTIAEGNYSRVVY